MGRQMQAGAHGDLEVGRTDHVELGRDRSATAEIRAHGRKQTRRRLEAGARSLRDDHHGHAARRRQDRGRSGWWSATACTLPTETPGVSRARRSKSVERRGARRAGEIGEQARLQIGDRRGRTAAAGGERLQDVERRRPPARAPRESAFGPARCRAAPPPTRETEIDERAGRGTPPAPTVAEAQLGGVGIEHNDRRRGAGAVPVGRHRPARSRHPPAGMTVTCVLSKTSGALGAGHAWSRAGREDADPRGRCWSPA